MSPLKPATRTELEPTQHVHLSSPCQASPHCCHTRDHDTPVTVGSLICLDTLALLYTENYLATSSAVHVLVLALHLLGMATRFEGVYYVLRHEAGIELGLRAHTVRCVTPSLSNHALLQTCPRVASLLPPVFCPAYLSLIGHDTVVPASRATPSYVWPSVTWNVCTGARYSSHCSLQVGTRSWGRRALMRLRPHMHPRLGKCSGWCCGAHFGHSWYLGYEEGKGDEDGK
jgi:hypothetical protein